MVRVLVAILLFAGIALAGCLGGDDTIDRSDGTEGSGQPDEGTGSIKGRVLTEDLDEVPNARVSLVQDAELVAEASTGDDGRYAIDSVAPGQYRLQITAPCCREHVQGIEVIEGETVNVDIQLTRFTATDLQMPYMTEYEWSGFLACAFSAYALATDGCASVDPEAERTTFFEVQPGLKTLTAALVWEAPGFTGNELQYGVATTCGTCTTPTDYYGYDVGTSPLELRIDEGEGNGGRSWEGMEETTELQWRVFPPFYTVEVYYQVEFTVYYQLHYHAPAAEGYNPLPDM